ncbi:MAG: UDP-N-acetylmuramoyl-L-alanyl-D-glutamate--2,6-diaminopimelate ligase [Candidatus Omnitrophica bacterium]|nr:UDP-N-acetylmuramoyl-L-alanyl-D-glutamate--2,6-diaminopimelate ligase [Candidatus Omnitrophota bacterium]
MISLKALFEEAYPERREFSSLPDLEIRGLECDSRKVGKDFLFLAVRGVKQDGGDFVREAIERGASAVAGERPLDLPGAIPFILVPGCREAASRLAGSFYRHPARHLQVIGITGTNGKTTCSYLVEHFLKTSGREVGVIGTVNTRFAGRQIPASETTPGPLRLQSIFSEMVSAGLPYAVMEVSSHALDQGRVSGIDFAAALFTNLTQDHLDYHKTLEAYFEAKSRLFTGLSPGQFSVINGDDPWGQKLKKKIRSRDLTYAVKEQADFRAREIAAGLKDTKFSLSYPEGRLEVVSPLLGLHNVYNALGSLAVASAMGLDVKKCAESLRYFEGVPGRLEAVDGGQDFAVFVDFAHTPDGLENVLRSLAPYKTAKLITVFGCGGERDTGKRPRMGRIAAEYSDSVIVTSDNPRSEDPKEIAGEVCAGFPADFKKYSVVLDRKKAIRQALLSARRGDIVLLAGKGHEREQVIGRERIPFSDREEAERVLRGN